MSQVFYSPALYHWEKQPISAGSQATVLQSTAYVLFPNLEVAAPVRLLYVAVRQDNTDAAAKSLTVYLNVDDVARGTTFAAADNTWYYMRHSAATDGLTNSTDIVNVSFYEDSRHLAAAGSVTCNDVPGTAQRLDMYVQYEVLRRGGIYR